MTFDFTPPPKLLRITPEILAHVDDDEIEGSLVDYVLDHRVDAEDDVVAIAELPEALQCWFIAFAVDIDVLNGGFNQLFFNQPHIVVAAPDAFERMGMHSAAALARRALDLIEQHAPALEAAAEAGTIDAFMETYLDQPFSDLDEEYSAVQEEFRAARLRFIREHAEEFRHP